VYDSPISSLTLSDLSEGIQYFHIQFKNADGWGKVTHYRLAVDSEKPTAFTINLSEGNDPSNPQQTLVFSVTDAASKVNRYMVQLDGKEPYEFIDSTGSSTHTLPAVEPGYHTVAVEAFDEAGGSTVGTFSFTVSAFEKPQFTEYPHEINEQVIPVIKGTTKPKAKVEVTMMQLGLGVSQAQAVITKEVMSNDQGEFVFIPDGKLTLGVYELTAFATDEYGARSEVSDPVRIAVQQPGYLRIGTLMVSFFSILIPLVAMLALSALGVWLLLTRYKIFKRGVRKEATEAHKMLGSEFAHLKEVLIEKRSELEATRKTKKLTKAEDELFAALAGALLTSEKRVQKEIVDVEHLVD
jgi:hypothetical protein